MKSLVMKSLEIKHKRRDIMSNTIIDTEIKLKLHLTLFKKTAMKQGANPFSVCPAFGHYYQII